MDSEYCPASIDYDEGICEYRRCIDRTYGHENSVSPVDRLNVALLKHPIQQLRCLVGWPYLLLQAFRIIKKYVFSAGRYRHPTTAIRRYRRRLSKMLQLL